VRPFVRTSGTCGRWGEWAFRSRPRWAERRSQRALVGATAARASIRGLLPELGTPRSRATACAETLREPRPRVGPARGRGRPFSRPRTRRTLRKRRTHAAVERRIGRFGGSGQPLLASGLRPMFARTPDRMSRRCEGVVVPCAVWDGLPHMSRLRSRSSKGGRGAESGRRAGTSYKA